VTGGGPGDDLHVALLHLQHPEIEPWPDPLDDVEQVAAGLMSIEEHIPISDRRAPGSWGAAEARLRHVYEQLTGDSWRGD
jgi:hypothetical protein